MCPSRKAQGSEHYYFPWLESRAALFQHHIMDSAADLRAVQTDILKHPNPTNDLIYSYNDEATI